jgi:hypothetical protein
MKTLISLFGFLALTSIHAQSFTYQLNTITELNVSPPSGNSPWLSAAFTDVGVNHVRLELTANMIDDEFISMFGLNVDPGININSLTFSNVDTEGTFSLPTISKSMDRISGGQGTRFDVGFDFSTSNSSGGSRRFNQNDSVTYDILYSGSGTFNSDSFDFLDKTGSRYTIAHVQSIGECNTSAWITTPTVPEPSSAALLGLVGTLVLCRRRK